MSSLLFKAMCYVKSPCVAKLGMGRSSSLVRSCSSCRVAALSSVRQLVVMAIDVATPPEDLGGYNTMRDPPKAS